MDRELQQAFSEVNAKLDRLTDVFHGHATEDARMFAEATGRHQATMDMMSRHLDEHRQTRKWWGALFGGVIVATVSAAWAWAKAHFTKQN